MDELSKVFSPLLDDGRLLAGLCLSVVFAIVTGALNVGIFYLFGVPLLGLVLGLIFIAVSRARFLVKIALAATSLSFIPLSFFASLQLGRGPAETFLIPKGYRGEIAVFFGEKCGRPLTTENARRVYALESDGILITQFSKPRGYLDQEFYYVDEQGGRENIPFFNRQDFETENRERLGAIPNSELRPDSTGIFWGYGLEINQISNDSLGLYVSDFNDMKKDDHEKFMEKKVFLKRAAEKLKQCHQTL